MMRGHENEGLNKACGFRSWIVEVIHKRGGNEINGETVYEERHK
jgi:hypothetical protein